jgi:hypothetical protein
MIVLVTVRNSLIVFALFSLIGGMAVIVTSIMLIIGLRKVTKYVFLLKIGIIHLHAI